MKNDSKSNLCELDSLMRSGYGYLANNAGKVISLITLFVAALVTFTDVSFSAFTGESFTTGLILMLLASYIMYFSLEGSGEKFGESTDEFSSALKKYNEIKQRINADDISLLREFCYCYAKKDAEYRRKSFLCEAGFTENEFLEYKNGASVSKKARRVFLRCERIKAVNLTPAVLLCKERLLSKSELTSPERAKLLSMLIGLLPTTLGTFFTVSVMLTVKDEMTASAVIEGILKLSALPIIGFKGYSSGYSYSKNNKSVWIETKARLLEEFLIEKNAKKT